MRCKALSKQRRSQCRQPAVRGMDVCHYHGGKTPRGPALPQFKTGRYSRLLPSRLLARYEEAENDAELTSLRDELAMLDARLADLLSRVDSGESGALWRDLKQAHDAFKRWRRLGNVDKMQDSLAALEARIEAAAQDYEAWAAILDLLEQRRKLAESEHRRLITLGSMISAERATLMLGLVIEIIRRHITDRRVLSSIAREFHRLGQGGDVTHELDEDQSSDSPRHGSVSLPPG